MFGIIIYTFLLSQFILGHIGLAKLFKKAGIDSWKAYVPFLNAWEWIKLIEKPNYWIVLLCLPIFNIFTYLSMVVELIRGFNKLTLKEEIIALFFPGYYFFYISREEGLKWYGIEKKKKSDWLESIIFALYAATLIRWSTFEPYMIPTSSMEGSLLVGDFLFVSKMHYGPRTPMTPLQLPLTHQTFPWVGKDDLQAGNYTPTFLDIPFLRLPYFRLPGFTSVKRNDVVVFNFPGYDNGFNEMDKPADLRTNYIKRCVAQAGDKISSKKGVIFVNGKKMENHEETQHNYLFMSKKEIPSNVFDKLKIREYNNRIKNNGSIIRDYNKIFMPEQIDVDIAQNQYPKEPSKVQNRINSMAYNYNKIKELVNDSSYSHFYHFPMNEKQRKRIESIPVVRETIKMNTLPAYGKGPLFFEKAYNGTKILTTFNDTLQDLDNFNEFTIPFKGMKLELNDKNKKFLLSHYGYLIEYYEYNNGQYIIDDKNRLLKNGKEVKEYTFKQNYYFMIGDNRHGSLDSRYWGFVPEDHIVGKAIFVWFSRESGLFKKLNFFESIRWERIFKPIE